VYTDYTPEAIDFDYRDALASPLMDMLSVRYVVTQKTTSLEEVPNYELA
jgi:hypothetical protein